jgi:hypothetical protein
MPGVRVRGCAGVAGGDDGGDGDGGDAGGGEIAEVPGWAGLPAVPHAAAASARIRIGPIIIDLNALRIATSRDLPAGPPGGLAVPRLRYDRPL